MSRAAASPLKDDRATKRSRKSLEPEDMHKVPDTVAEIVADGDAILVMNGLSTAPETPIGLRVSTSALGLASPVFKAAFADVHKVDKATDPDQPSETVLAAPEDDSDALYILANILHLRNDKLPSRVLPDLLYKIAVLANKYQCVVAVGRATHPWFEQLYASKENDGTWTLIESAYLLDQPTFFARFTNRWVLRQPLFHLKMPVATTTETQQLAVLIFERAMRANTTLRNDVDFLADSCALVFSEDVKHYIDYAPGMSPEPNDGGGGRNDCHVDSQGAMEYLGALRDADIWPPTKWQELTTNRSAGASVQTLVDKLISFREPDYDDCDKCDFCEGVKVNFTKQLERTRENQRDRLWGLCLDCYNSGSTNPGECRYEHAKPHLPQSTGLGIQGL